MKKRTEEEDDDGGGDDDDNDEEHCRFKKTSFVPDFPFCELHRGPQGHVRTRQLHSVRRVEVCSFFFIFHHFYFYLPPQHSVLLLNGNQEPGAMWERSD